MISARDLQFHRLGAVAELFHEDQISARGQCDDIDPIGAVDDVKIVLRPGAWRLLAVGANGEAAKIGEGTGEISGLDLIAGVCFESVLEDSAFAPEHEGRPRYAT